jgi:hypothetical protein
LPSYSYYIGDGRMMPFLFLFSMLFLLIAATE